MSELVTCKDLTKRFGNHTALDHLNLSLDSGKIIGLLGPNGSGKTTLLKLLNGLLTPSEGEVLIAGNHPGIETKRIVSYLPERSCLGDWMKVSDLLDEADPIESSYIFEVASAGAERPLKRPGDFEQFMGSPVLLKTYKPVDGRKEFSGDLAGYDNGAVTLRIGEEEKRFEKDAVALVRLRCDF